jgi:hypothetical protein
VQLVWLAGAQRRRDDREIPVGKNVSERLAQDRGGRSRDLFVSLLLDRMTRMRPFDRDFYYDDHRRYDDDGRQLGGDGALWQ